MTADLALVAELRGLRNLSALVAPETINTIPGKTLQAVADHGIVARIGGLPPALSSEVG